MTTSTSDLSFETLLTRPENLYWAWLKYRRYLQSAHVWIDERDLACFEANLHAELAEIAAQFRQLTYRLAPIRPLPFPQSFYDRNYGRAGHIFHISVRDQVAWIAFLNVIGPWLDWQMPAWSYGGRLYRSTWSEEKNGSAVVKIGCYRHSSGYLYRNLREAWSLYQRHVFLTARAMAGSLNPEDLDEPERKVLEQEQNVAIRHKLPYLVDGYWKASANQEVYRAQLTFDTCSSGFNLSCTLNNLSTFSNDFQTEIRQLASHLLDFRLDLHDWNEEALDNLGLFDGREELRTIPRGLAVAGFLKNVVLMEVDRRITRRQVSSPKSTPFSHSEFDIAHFRFGDDHFILGRDFSSLVNWMEEYQTICDACFCGITLDLKSVKPQTLAAYLSLNRKRSETRQSLDGSREKAQKSCLLDCTYPLPVMTKTLRLLTNLADMEFDLLQQEEKSHYIDEMENLLLDENSGTELNKDFQIDIVARKLAWSAPQEIIGNQANLCQIERQLFEDRMHVTSIRKRLKTLRKETMEAEVALKQLNQAQQRIGRLEQMHRSVAAGNIQKQRKNRMHIFSMLLKALRDHLEKLNLWFYLLQYCQFSGHNDLEPIHEELKRFHSLDPFRAGYVRALVCQIMANQAVQCAINMSQKDHLIYRREAAYSYLKGLLNRPVTIPEDATPTFYEIHSLHLLQCAFGSALLYLQHVKNELITDGDFLLMQRLAHKCDAIDWTSHPDKWAAKTSVPLSVWTWWAESRLNPVQRTKSGPVWKAAVGKLEINESCTWPLLSKYPREVIQEVGMKKMIEACRAGNVFTRKDYAGWLHELLEGADLTQYERRRGEKLSGTEEKVLSIMKRSRDRWIPLDQWVRWSRVKYQENAFDPRVTEWTALEITDHIIEKVKALLRCENRNTYSLHPLNILLPHQWANEKENILTWEHWRERIREKHHILKLRETGWIDDYRYMPVLNPEMMTGHEIRMIRGLGLLLLGLVSHSFYWPAIWNVRGHEWQYISLVRARMRNVPFSSWTHAILEACLLPRQLETAQLEVSLLRKFDDDTALDPPKIVNLCQFQSCIRKARQVLEGYQMTLQHHIPRQLIPVKLEHFTHPDWRNDFGMKV